MGQESGSCFGGGIERSHRVSPLFSAPILAGKRFSSKLLGGLEQTVTQGDVETHRKV